MINATRSTTESKKTAESSKPAQASKAAEARLSSPAPESKTASEPEPAPAQPVSDKAAVSEEAAAGGEDDEDVLERVRAGISEKKPGEKGKPEKEDLGGGVGVAAAELSKGPLQPKEPEEPTPEEQALDNLDQYGDIYDNPGDAEDPDGKISQDDIEAIASGDYDMDAARKYLEDKGLSQDEIDETLMSIEESAEYLQTHDDLRNRLDVGNDKDNGTDGTISRGDISRVIFDRQNELAEQGELAPGDRATNRDTYPEVDTVDERTAEVIAQQEASVLEAVTSGQPVEFTNANGETEMLSITQVDSSGGNTVYEIVGEDGHKITVSSELGATDNRTALARVADYYSQLPPGVRESVSEIELLNDPKEGVAADYSDGHVNFYDGLEHLNEEVFNHEYGHGIGYGETDDGVPEGWGDAIEEDGAKPSDYSDKNQKEDFAESWAAYLEARENGPEALERLMEAYPERFAILEQIYQEAA